jgi:ribosomal protein S17
MILIIVIVAIAALVVTVYMQKRIVLRKEQEHKRNMERFERLIEQLKKTNPHQQENENSNE